MPSNPGCSGSPTAVTAHCAAGDRSRAPTGAAPGRVALSAAARRSGLPHPGVLRGRRGRPLPAARRRLAGPGARGTARLSTTAAGTGHLPGPAPGPAHDPHPNGSPARSEPFLFRTAFARPGDTLLLCTAGLAEPLREEPAFAARLADRWSADGPPGLVDFLTTAQLRAGDHPKDRTAVGVWES
ncbi:hypothetical protein O1L68_07645 [Streptomyces lydicus]|nr:hypothetical protein [Streptomyces lydicus]